jgi:hypothetical protein
MKRLYPLPLYFLESFLSLPPLSANLRPTFPKQTQLQNNTLRIQIPPSRLSVLMYALNLMPADGEFEPVVDASWSVEFRREEVGDGIISGLERRRSVVPVAPTKLERRKPAVERSIMYQRTGLTRKSVRETWSVDVQGSFL